jgi:hypothetical protein
VAHDMFSQAGPFTPLGIHQDVPSVTVAVKVVQKLVRFLLTHGTSVIHPVPISEPCRQLHPLRRGRREQV